MLTSALKTIVNKQVEENIYIYIYISFLWEIEKVVKILFAFFFFSYKNFSKMVH